MDVIWGTAAGAEIGQETILFTAEKVSATQLEEVTRLARADGYRLIYISRDLAAAATMFSMDTYCIVRHYLNRYGTRVIARGLTLTEAQAHCANPQNSSSTCTTAAAKAITRRNGPWFDGYEMERRGTRDLFQSMYRRHLSTR